MLMPHWSEVTIFRIMHCGRKARTCQWRWMAAVGLGCRVIPTSYESPILSGEMGTVLRSRRIGGFFCTAGESSYRRDSDPFVMCVISNSGALQCGHAGEIKFPPADERKKM